MIQEKSPAKKDPTWPGAHGGEACEGASRPMVKKLKGDEGKRE
mgnify:CR=1 FL=1